MMGILKSNPEKPAWYRYINNRVDRNKNFIGFVSGPTGSGKSYSTLGMCEEIDRHGFTPEQIVFNPQEMMALINSGKLKKGSCIAFEEAGISMDATKWQSTMNQMIRYLLETFRHRNFVLIINSPYMDFVDSGTRRLFHAEFQTRGIDYKNQMGILKPMLLQYNARYRKWYHKYLRVATDKGIVPVSSLRIKKPSVALLKNYEERKRAFTDKLNKTIEEELNKAKEEKKRYHLRCNRCDYSWKSFKEDPVECPKCRTRHWNKPQNGGKKATGGFRSEKKGRADISAPF